MPVMKCLKKFVYKGAAIKPGQTFKVKDYDVNVLLLWKYAEKYKAPKPQAYKTRELVAETPDCNTDDTGVLSDLCPPSQADDRPITDTVEPTWQTPESSWDKIPPEAHTTPSEDYSAWTKPRLQAELDARGIEWKAWESKATLIDRLR